MCLVCRYWVAEPWRRRLTPEAMTRRYIRRLSMAPICLVPSRHKLDLNREPDKEFLKIECRKCLYKLKA